MGHCYGKLVSCRELIINTRNMVMNSKTIHDFDLPALLRLGSLDIRGIAAKNPPLVTEEYFVMLKEFINQAQNVTDALTKISDCSGEKSDFQHLADIKNILEAVGCSRFTPAFDEIIDAEKKDGITSAAERAKNIQDDFTAFYKRVISAARTENSKPLFNAQNPSGIPNEIPVTSYSAHSLKNVLAMLEQMEATRKLRVLAIDDAPVILKTIVSVLSDEYKVFTLANPAQLENFLQQITPDLFLLDYKMPALSGFDLIPVIRNFEEHKDTPIIFLTSMGTSDHVSAALSLGACDFIVKPINGKILREKTAKHIVRKKLP